MRLVIALGGNAILRKGEQMSPSVEWRNVRAAADLIARSVADGDQLVVTHGNGPQVGYLAEIMEVARGSHVPQDLSLTNAMTQGWLGFMIAHALERAFAGTRKVVAMVTRSLVSLDDPEFSSPSKFVGSYYTEEAAKALSKEYGWRFKPDPRGGYRRVVPSPRPLGILETDIIRDLAARGVVVVAVGGGGIPVARDPQGFLIPVDAVVDKDLASSLLASMIEAEEFVILTDVDGIALDFGKPTQRWLREVRVDELEQLYRQGIFPSGSMGPKVLAAIEFVRRTGREAIIGNLDRAADVIAGRSGTVVLPG